jgi:uncharacterized membrane protein
MIMRWLSTHAADTITFVSSSRKHDAQCGLPIGKLHDPLAERPRLAAADLTLRFRHHIHALFLRHNSCNFQYASVILPRPAGRRRNRGKKGFAVVVTVFTEWSSLIVRWLHVVAGIAWIGSSFYFIHLDLSLKPRSGLPQGVQGDAWQVHGGGFYHAVKYLIAPARMPDELTWFKWEAYTTWLSGFALLVIVYYLGADLYLIDKSVLDLTAPTAAAIAFASLVLAWLIYETLCRSALGRHEVALALVGYVFLVALTYGFTHVFSGRGAFTQIGALIGTIMVANVFVIIIPNQKKTVAALLPGKEPAAAWGEEAKQRSVHNNYLTLPVIFLMIANHYPLMFATRFNWLIVAIVLAIGPVIRHFFNCRHEGKGSPWWTWGVAAAGMIAVAWLSGAGPADIGPRAERIPALVAGIGQLGAIQSEPPSDGGAPGEAINLGVLVAR